MKEYSRIHRDQPLTPAQRAAYRIDYTIRYKGADHLRSAALSLSWYQYWMVDILLAGVCLTMAVTWIVYGALSRHWGRQLKQYEFGKPEFVPLVFSTRYSIPPSDSPTRKGFGWFRFATSSKVNGRSSTNNMPRLLACMPRSWHRVSSFIFTSCIALRFKLQSLCTPDNNSWTLMTPVKVPASLLFRFINFLLDTLQCLFRPGSSQTSSSCSHFKTDSDPENEEAKKKFDDISFGSTGSLELTDAGAGAVVVPVREDSHAYRQYNQMSEPNTRGASALVRVMPEHASTTAETLTSTSSEQSCTGSPQSGSLSPFPCAAAHLQYAAVWNDLGDEKNDSRIRKLVKTECFDFG